MGKHRKSVYTNLIVVGCLSSPALAYFAYSDLIAGEDSTILGPLWLALLVFSLAVVAYSAYVILAKKYYSQGV